MANDEFFPLGRIIRATNLKFFKAYGSYLIARFRHPLAIVGGYKFERQRRAAEAARGGDALSHAVEFDRGGNRETEAEKALATLAGNGPGAYRATRRLHAAAELVANKHLEFALQGLCGICRRRGCASALWCFACIQIAALSVDKEKLRVCWPVSWKVSAVRNGCCLPPRRFWSCPRTRKAKRTKVSSSGKL